MSVLKKLINKGANHKEAIFEMQTKIQTGQVGAGTVAGAGGSWGSNSPPHIIRSQDTGLAYTGSILEEDHTTEPVQNGVVLRSTNIETGTDCYFYGMGGIWVPVGDPSFNPANPPYIAGSNGEDYIFVDDDNNSTSTNACFIFMPSNNPLAITNKNIPDYETQCISATGNISNGQIFTVNAGLCSSYWVYIISKEFSRFPTDVRPIIINGAAFDYQKLRQRGETLYRAFKTDTAGNESMRYSTLSGQGLILMNAAQNSDGWGNDPVLDRNNNLTRYTLSQAEYEALVALINP